MPNTRTEHTTGPVTREEAIKFLESAVRNWLHVPRLSNHDIDDVAGALTSFLKTRGAA